MGIFGECSDEKTRIKGKKYEGSHQIGELDNISLAYFIEGDKTFAFMKCIEEGLPYWKMFLVDILLMVKQVGLPTFL